MSDQQWQTNLLNINVWLRLLYMLLTTIGVLITWYLVIIVSVTQFLLVLITGKDNDNLRNFGQGLSKWISQGLMFLTFNNDKKPYPFSEWPDIEQTESYVAPEVEASVVVEPESKATDSVDDSGEAEAAPEESEPPQLEVDEDEGKNKKGEDGSNEKT